jgi:protein-tyrosine-phosphatase
LQNLISLVDSAGTDPDPEPSDHACRGVKLFLQDRGIHPDYRHTTRSVCDDDFAYFHHVLAMNSYQIRDLQYIAESYENQNPTLECRLLGSFDGEYPRGVAEPECIGGREWFEVNGARIYPGYEKCFGQIKKYIHEFILNVFGYDVETPNQHDEGLEN